MKLESHATPLEGTPQQRYATLHRAIEQGLDSDDLWCELASVSSTLGHHREAQRCVARIRDVVRRSKFERAFALGTKARSTQADHPAAAPAASNAGPTKRRAKRPELQKGDPGVVDHLVDAGQYMVHQHMPWLVLTTMLAFPLIVGVGGMLTAGESLVLLAALAAVPGLCVLTVVAAMAHEILHKSSNGEGDVPELPEFTQLLHGARTFLWDATLVLALFFGAPVAMTVAGMPLTNALPSLAIGIYFAPLAFALRHVRRDMRSFAPVFLWRAARRSGRGYGLVALAITLAFSPAVFVGSAVTSYAVWVQVAVVGPLCVLPTLAAARLLGTWLDTHRKSLGYLLTTDASAPTGKQPLGIRQPQKPTERRDLRRPQALESFKPPVAKNVRTARKSAPARPVRPASARPGKKRPAPRAIEGRRPVTKSPDPAPAPQAQATDNTEVPEISGIAGAYMVTGEERQRRGAASRPQ